MTKRILITIEYDGAPFVGWQRQDNGASVQAALEAAAEAFIGAPTPITGAGRTDSGVHATGQAAHLDVPEKFDANRVMQALNAHLGAVPVTVHSAREVPATLHARFSATGRRYLYRILPQRQKPALDLGRVWHHRKPLDSTRPHKYLLADMILPAFGPASVRPAHQCGQSTDYLFSASVMKYICRLKPVHFCIIRCGILSAHWRLSVSENGTLPICNRRLLPVTGSPPGQPHRHGVCILSGLIMPS